MQLGQADFAPEGYHCYWYSAEKKGYSGTAIFTKHEPVSVSYGIGVDEHDHEGRAITLEYDNFYLLNVYTPNAQRELARLEYRMSWEDALRAYIKSLDAKKPVIYCGDLNVAHEEIDLKNPKTNHHSAGFSDEERGKFTDLLKEGFVRLTGLRSAKNGKPYNATVYLDDSGSGYPRFRMEFEKKGGKR